MVLCTREVIHCDRRPNSNREITCQPSHFVLPDIPIMGDYTASPNIPTLFPQGERRLRGFIFRSTPVRPPAFEVHGNIHLDHESNIDCKFARQNWDPAFVKLNFFCTKSSSIFRKKYSYLPRGQPQEELIQRSLHNRKSWIQWWLGKSQ